MKTYTNSYTFDKGLNLIQRTSSLGQTRLIVEPHSNRAINVLLINRLATSTGASLNSGFVNEGVFDKAGNQLKSVSNVALSWDYRSMLQNTLTDLKDESGTVIGELREYNLYVKTGRRNRKISEKTDAAGNKVEIQEALYLGNLEYRSTWVGRDLDYNGETVSEENQPQPPYEAYIALRIRQGHKQVAEKRIYTFKDGNQVSDIASFYSLDNNIDSCELQLNTQGGLENYYASKPYGETAVSYGKSKQHPYKYSGQEKDQSGLYYYGYRSLLPQNFRWMSPDPAGIQGSGLSWYTMVSGNPVSFRDLKGLLGLDEVLAQEGLTKHLLLYAGDHNANKKHLPLIRKHIPRKILLKEHNAQVYRALAWVGYDRNQQKPMQANDYNQLEVTAIQGFLSEIDRVAVPNEVVGLISGYISDKTPPATIEQRAFDVNDEAFVGHTSNHRINGGEYVTANVTLRSYRDYDLVQEKLNENPNFTHNRLKDPFWIDNILKPLGIADVADLAGPENIVALVGPGHPFPLDQVKSKGISHAIEGFIMFQDTRDNASETSLEHESSFDLVNNLNAVGILPMELQANNPSAMNAYMRMQKVNYIRQHYNYRENVDINGVNHIVFWKRGTAGPGSTYRPMGGATNQESGCCKIL